MTPMPYTSLEALLHDPFWAAEGAPVELDFLEAVLRDHPGPSLEVGCGSGRLLLPLLQKGHEVEGLDLSPDMLALCHASAAALALTPPPVLHQGDMATFDPGKTYASLLLPAFTLQMAPDPAAALAHFHRLLAPAGWLYLSVFRPLAELNRELPENEWYADHETTLPDGRRASIATRHRLDRKNRILVREHHYRLAGPDSTEEHHSEQTLRWFTPRQLHGLLTRAGFTPITGFADFDPELPVDDDAQIVTVIARRELAPTGRQTPAQG